MSDILKSDVAGLKPLGGGLFEQIGTATFTTTTTQITTIPTKLTYLEPASQAFPTGESVNANDVISVTIGAVSGGTVTVTRPGSGTSGLVIGYRLVGRLNVAVS